MSKEIDEHCLKPLLYQFNDLYSKYTLLCSTNYKQFENPDSYKQSFSFTAVELFKLLDDDFEKVFYEIKKLEHRLADDRE